MTSKKILVTLPNYDTVTEYLSTWAEDVMKVSPRYSIKSIKLEGKNITRPNFQKYLQQHKISFVWLNGHGNSLAVFGHKNEPIICKDDNEEIVSGKIVYALSCESAAVLGVSAVNKGTEAFLGYDLPFCFLTNKNKECQPENDEIANIFKEPSNAIPLALIKGQTVNDAVDRSKQKYSELINKFSASNALPEAGSIRQWLFWNMSGLQVIGNGDARI